MVRALFVAIFLSLAGLPASASAKGIPDLSRSHASTAAGPAVVSVYTLPNGAGRPLSLARTVTGDINATITLTLLDAYGFPIFMYPAEDLWLETSLKTSTTGMSHCAGGTVADSHTNALGVTTFSNAIFGGRQSNRVLAEKTIVLVSGTPLIGSQLNILFNSADIDGDLLVNLADTVRFATDMNGIYNYRSDFYFDDLLNLSDVVLYAIGLGAECP